MRPFHRRWLGLFCCSLLLVLEALGQNGGIPRDLRGDETRIARGILDGNLIETNFRNHGELSRWNDLPWGVWPRGIGGRHIDGVGIIVAGQVLGEREKWPGFFPGLPDTTLNPMILTYRDAGKRLGPNGEIWGWLPLPGFHNENRFDPITGQRTPTPALSDDNTSWPEFWPDRLDNPDDPGWPGQWNGFFGRGVFNADLESFYVIDDHSDMEYAFDPLLDRPNSEYGVFYPSPGDSTVGGLGLQTQVRLFQWANVLAEDVMFVLYRITNVGETEYLPPPFPSDRGLIFAQIMDYGLGEEEGDENGEFNPQEDVAFGWDQDGIGTRPGGGTYNLGYTGFAFLESPARASDGQDNDEDGITDESRFNGPGMLIEGQLSIRAFVEANYDLTNFAVFNSSNPDDPQSFEAVLTSRPAFQAGQWWTGDENLDWVGFLDDNGNGVVDPGESVNNDVGRDGLGPFDFGYPGPDDGEADGIPTPGEPNFDELDVDESDQVGLTGFDLQTRPFYENGNNLREDSWLWERIIDFAQFPLGTKPEAFAADIEPFLLFTSGPVGLEPGATDFFSTAWIFGQDRQDFFKNRRTVQSIFNADYQFAQPPFLPTLTAVPGDGRVVLSWDDIALSSFDRFSQQFDFEGFKLYKGTDPLLSDARLISDVNGTPTFYKPLAQWDLDNGIRGSIPVLGGESVYNLGDDTGLSFVYIDEEVTNGITYYYALVAYDHGFPEATLASTSGVSLDPQENTFNVSVTQAGTLVGISKNAAAVTPRATPAGFVEGGTNEDLSRVAGGIGTGSASVRILNENLVKLETVYEISFFDTLAGIGADLYNTAAYKVVNVTEGTVPVDSTEFVDSTPFIEGFNIELSNNSQIGLIADRTGFVANAGSPNEVYSLDPQELDGYSSNWIANIREDTTTAFVKSPFDYELRWVGDSLYTPPRLFGFLREPIPIFAFNRTRNRPAGLLIVDMNDSETFDAGDDLIVFEDPPTAGPRRFRYRITFTPPDGGASVPPGPGNVLRIGVTRPFATGDFFRFTLRKSAIDAERAKGELDQIAVVPNPYVGASGFEPRSQIEGRGERRVQFIHLPPQCTIKIFNVRGELVKTLVHDGVTSDGAEFWDLKTEGNQDVAYGVYLFHVEAPGIGERVGKFALIK